MTDAIPARVLSAFGLERCAASLLDAGGPNTSWRLRGEAGDFVLKHLAAAPSSAWLEFQAEVLVRGARTGRLAVEPPMRTQTGELTVVDGDGAWQLRRHVVGRRYKLGEAGDFEQALGQLERLHELDCAAASPRCAKPDLEAWLERFDETLEATVAATRRVAGGRGPELERAYRSAAAAAELNAHAYAALPMALSHGEFQGNNLLFDRGRLVALIDWDSLQRRARVYDLATAALFLARARRGGFELDVPVVLSALRRFAPTAAERRAIAPLLRFAFLPTARFIEFAHARRPALFDWYWDWCLAGLATVADLAPLLAGGRRAIALRRGPAEVVLVAEAESRDAALATWARYCRATTLTDAPTGAWTVIASPPATPEPDADAREVAIVAPGEPAARYAFSPGSRRLWIRAPTDDAWQARHGARLIRVLMRLQLLERGALFLHAGLVRVAGRGLAFVGAKRAGKTSSILAQLATGAEYVTNDDLAVVRDHGRWTGLGWPRTVSIRPDTLAAIEARYNVRMDTAALQHPANHSAGPGGASLAYPHEIARWFGCATRAQSSLDALVFPRFVDGPAALERLEPGAAAEWLRASWTRDPNKYEGFLLTSFAVPSQDQLMAELAALAAGLPCYELRQSFAELARAAELVHAAAEGMKP